MSTYPIFCGAIVVNSANNKLRWNESGTVYDATLASGTYYITGVGTSEDLCKAIKDAIQAASASPNVYSVTAALFSVDPSALPCQVRFTRTSGVDNFGLIKDGSETFDYSLIGYSVSTAVNSSAKGSDIPPGAVWVSNDGFANFQRNSQKIIGETRAASGRLQQVNRSDRMYNYDLDLVFVDEGRLFIETPTLHVNNTLEQFMETFGAGAQFRLYFSPLASGFDITNPAGSTLMGTMIFSADTLSDFQPEQLGVGMNLYDVSLRLFKVV
jgi:hypothetical protein